MKLPKGMFQRGRSYYVRLFEGGRDKWVSLGRDVEEAVRQLAKLRHGDALAPDLSVGGAAQRWLESYVRANRNQDGHTLAGVRLKRYLVPFMGERRLAKVRKEDLRAYRLWLGRHGLADQTVAHVLSDARCFFGWAEDSGLIDASPVPKRLLPRIQERPPDRLTDAEVQGACRAPRAIRVPGSTRPGHRNAMGRAVPRSGRRRAARHARGQPHEDRARASGSRPPRASRRVEPEGGSARVVSAKQPCELHSNGEATERGRGVPRPPASPHVCLPVAGERRKPRGPPAGPRAQHRRDDPALREAGRGRDPA